MLVGREKDLEKVKELLEKYKVLHLTGNAGVGKTAIVKEIIKDYPRHIYFNYSIDSYTQLMKLVDEKMIEEKKELITPTEFLEIIRKLSEEDVLRILMTLKNKIEDADIVVWDSADKYGEFGAKVIEYLALYSEVKLLIVTRKENISKSLAEVIIRLMLDGIAAEYEIKPLDVKSLLELFPEADGSFAEYLLKITHGDLNYMKLLVGLRVSVEEKEILSAIKNQYMSLSEDERRIVNLLAISQVPLKFEDIRSLLEMEDDTVLNALDNLSMIGWITEEGECVKITSSKIMDIVMENLSEEEINKLHFMLGEHFERIGMHIAAAIHFEFVDRERSMVHYRTSGFEAMYMQNYSLALRFFEKAWEIGNDITDLYYMAKMYMEMGKIKEALSVMEGVEEDRFNYLRAWIYFMEGNLKESLRYAMKCESSQSPWLRVIGKIMQSFIYRNLGVYELAKDIAEEALRESEKMNYPEGIIYSLFNIGSVKMSMGEDGMEELKRAFELSEGTRIKYLFAMNYIYFLIMGNHLDKAKELIDKLLEECRKNAYQYEEKLILAEYGVFLKHTGEIPKAEEVFHDLYRFFIENNMAFFAVQVLVHIGECAIKLGRREVGIKYLREAWEKSLEMGHTSLIRLTYQKLKEYGAEVR